MFWISQYIKNKPGEFISTREPYLYSKIGLTQINNNAILIKLLLYNKKWEDIQKIGIFFINYNITKNFKKYHSDLAEAKLDLASAKKINLTKLKLITRILKTLI